MASRAGQLGDLFRTTAAVLALFACFSVLNVGVSAVGVEDTDLVQLQLIWRHGNRTRVAMDRYSNDPYKDVPDFEGVGNLNAHGKARAYLLGITLREKYGWFLGDVYLPKIHQVRSTDARRAMDSGMLVMAGLFPPGREMAWQSTGQEALGHLWQPIDLSFEHGSQDNLLGTSHVSCPAIQREKERIRASQELRKDEVRLAENGTVFEYLSLHTGDNINDSFITQGIYNALLCQEDKGWPLPQWTKEVYPEPLRSLCGLGLGQFGQTKLMQRLIVGPLIHEMITAAENATAGNTSKSAPRLLAFSGHDTNIVSLLAAMGFAEASNTVPRYSAHIAWEIRQSKLDRSPFVRVLFEGQELVLPGCDSRPLCPLSKVREILSDIMITREQHWKECTSATMKSR